MPIIGAIGNASEYAYRSNLVESPDPFDFTDLFNVEPGATYYSEYVKITGLKSSVRISIQPGASYSVFAGVFDNTNTNSLAFDNDFSTIANFSQDLDINLRYRTDQSFIKNNQSVRLAREIPAPVLTPASFDISSITFDAYNPRLSQNFLPTSTIPAIFGQTLTSVVSVGSSVQDWIIKVRDADITANLISFPDVVNIRAGIATTTASYVVSGLEKNVSFPANITSLNGGIIVDNIKPSVLSTQVQNGSIINLDTTSSIDYGTTKIVDFAIGTATTTWKVITEPLSLAARFTFYEQTIQRPGAISFRSLPSGAVASFGPLGSANLSTLYGTDGTGGYPLARFDIDGLNVGLATDITFTNGAQYNIFRSGSLIKNFTDPPQRVINGDSIRVRLTSASTYSTTVTTTATVGTTSQQVWSITTQPDPTPPPIIPPPPPIIPPPPPIIPPPPPTPAITYPINVEALYVGGGGGGGSAEGATTGSGPGGAGGGGGAGSALTALLFTINGPSSGRNASFVIGPGGTGSSNVNIRGGNGGSTTITLDNGTTFTAAGGGGGGNGRNAFVANLSIGACTAASGGGGGSGPNAVNAAVGGCGGLSPVGGGNGSHNTPNGYGMGGGGGGDAGPGGNAQPTVGGTGGAGRGGLQFLGTVRNSIFPNGYAGGGGGGQNNNPPGGAPGGAGQFGGGNGATNLRGVDAPSPNTGSGGGGGVFRTGGGNFPGGTGASGIVIIRYPAPNGATAATVTGPGANPPVWGTSNENNPANPTIAYAYHVITGTATITFN